MIRIDALKNQAEKKIIKVTNFRRNIQERNSQDLHFRIISSNELDDFSGNKYPNSVCLPLFLKPTNLTKMKERFLGFIEKGKSSEFLKLELELINVSSFVRITNGELNNFSNSQNIHEEILLLMNSLDKGDDPNYCYFNCDPKDDVVLCLNNGEFIRQVCPRHLNSNKSGFTLLFLDRTTTSSSCIFDNKQINTSSSNSNDIIHRSGGNIEEGFVNLAAAQERVYSSFEILHESYKTITENDELKQECKRHKPDHIEHKNHWTLDILQDLAKGYNTQNDFKNGNKDAYKYAHKHGILDDICKHMDSNWSESMLREEALKYKARSQFQLFSKTAFNAARKSGLLDEICQHMAVMKWSDIMLKDEALKFTTRKLFLKGNKKAYNIANKRGILNEICQHMIIRHTKWTDDMLRQEALKYKTKKEFELGHGSAYRTALRRGVVDDVCQHMASRSMTTEVKTNDDEIPVRNVEKRYNTRKLKPGRISHILVLESQDETEGEISENTSNYYNALKDRDYKYKSKKGAKRSNKRSYDEAHLQGIDHVRKYMKITKWTDTLLHEEALKYKTKKEFELGHGSAYRTALRRGVVDDICQHMVSSVTKWTDDRICDEALKYKSLKLFKLGSKNAYQAAKKRNLLEILFSDENCDDSEFGDKVMEIKEDSENIRSSRKTTSSSRSS